MKKLATEYLSLTYLNTERPKAFDAVGEYKPASPTRPSLSAPTAPTNVPTISQHFCSTTEQTRVGTGIQTRTQHRKRTNNHEKL